jgi:organic radical activating enzyme
MKLTLPFLEIMATQACNLSCVGCTNYSDLPVKGYLSWQQAKQSIQMWSQRLELPDFGIIGGEPLLNPTIDQWVVGLRELLPSTRIRFTTNGVLLHKKLEIVDLMHSVGNSLFKITVHQNNQQLECIIDEILKKYKWKTITEFGITRWVTDNNFKFQVNRPTKFIKTYIGEYSNMMPHNNNPLEAFKICCQPNCPLLYNGKIYKCSTSALLNDTLKHVGNPNLESWQPYLVNGLDIDSSDEDLKKFVDNYSKPNAICRMCPSAADVVSQLDHLENVSRKKYKINKKTG